MLYLVATPIGNLGDITLRALETLKSCDYILAEDTRVSLKLMRHYAIQKPLISFHSFNEARKEEGIIADLQAGKQIALISDAGTPLIQDPGLRLVQHCRQAGIPTTAIPGPCAAIMALCLSGMAVEPFQFVGFLPRTSGRLRTTCEQLLLYPGTTICYESPHRTVKTLRILAELDPTRQICMARELTKLHEEVRTESASDLLQRIEQRPPRGEVVLLIAGLAR